MKKNFKYLKVLPKTAESNWNKYLTTPLKRDEIVRIDKDQGNVELGYVRINYGINFTISGIFATYNFTCVEDINNKPMKIEINEKNKKKRLRY